MIVCDDDDEEDWLPPPPKNLVNLHKIHEDSTLKALRYIASLIYLVFVCLHFARVS